MGQRVEEEALTLDDKAAVRDRLERCVVAIEEMVDGKLFDHHCDTVGLEVELDLVEPLGGPHLANDRVLAKLDRPELQQELGQFNIELNVAPHRLAGDVLPVLHRELDATLDQCSQQAERLGARVMAIGTLPTLRPRHITVDLLSSNPRYALLSKRMHAERGEPFRVDIQGAERLRFESETVAAEAAATSLQLHLRVRPEDFARFYNAAQSAAVAQIAAGANSPYAFGLQLWAETRIPLCEQVLDVRPHVNGAPPRVWMGDHWVSSPTELFAENVRDFPPLLPILDGDDPTDALRAGQVPTLVELRMHGGTIWRWNRPVYDVQDGVPQLRIENRVLPSGPTPADMIANAALYFGLVRSLADETTPVWSRLPFAAVNSAVYSAARDGLAGSVAWVDRDAIDVRSLVLELLPQASQGLDAWGVDARDRDRYLGIIEDRVRSGRTGAWWQVSMTQRLEDRGLGRAAALREMTRTYVELAQTGAPVHTWPVRP